MPASLTYLQYVSTILRPFRSANDLVHAEVYDREASVRSFGTSCREYGVVKTWMSVHHINRPG